MLWTSRRFTGGPPSKEAAAEQPWGATVAGGTGLATSIIDPDEPEIDCRLGLIREPPRGAIASAG